MHAVGKPCNLYRFLRNSYGSYRISTGFLLNMYNLSLLWFLQPFLLDIAKKNLFTVNIWGAHLYLFKSPTDWFVFLPLFVWSPNFDECIILKIRQEVVNIWVTSQNSRRTARTGFSVSTQERFCLGRKTRKNIILTTPYRISTIIQTMLMPMYLPHPKELLKDLFKDSISNVYKVWSFLKSKIKAFRSWYYFKST